MQRHNLFQSMSHKRCKTGMRELANTRVIIDDSFMAQVTVSPLRQLFASVGVGSAKYPCLT